VRRVLHDNNFDGRVARKKPFISRKNIAARLKFTKVHIRLPISFWDDVIFADESKFNIFGSDGRKFVCRRRNIELENKYLDIQNISC